MPIEEEYQKLSALLTGFDELSDDSKLKVYTLSERVSEQAKTDEDVRMFCEATNAIISQELSGEIVIAEVSDIVALYESHIIRLSDEG